MVQGHHYIKHSLIMDMFLGLAKLNNLYIKVIFFLTGWHRWKWKYLLFLAHKKSAKNIMYIFLVCLGQQKKILIVEAQNQTQNTGFRSRFSFFCFHLRRMTFGKVNELGQFIREAEPEPDVKKSKGRTHTYTHLLLKTFFYPLSHWHTLAHVLYCVSWLLVMTYAKVLLMSSVWVQRVCCHGDK